MTDSQRAGRAVRRLPKNVHRGRQGWALAALAFVLCSLVLPLVAGAAPVAASASASAKAPASAAPKESAGPAASAPPGEESAPKETATPEATASGAPAEPAEPPAQTSASAAASVAPPAHEATVPHPAASAESVGPGAPVRLHERDVFVVRVPRAGRSPEERARAASQTLEKLAEEAEPAETRVEDKGDLAIVYGGKTPIIQLGAEDAQAAGDSSLSIHAASVAARVQEALRSEHQRTQIAKSVFSFSLAIFSGLIAVLVVKKLTDLVDRSRAWVAAHPDKIPALRIQSIDIVRPAALRGGISIALGIGRLVTQLGVFYTWIIVAFSLFESTRGYTERLTGFVLTPVSALMGRVGSAVPLLVIAAVASLATVILVRFVGLFFGSVARGETTLGWLPSDLALPTSVLVRAGIVIVFIIVAAPMITGNDDGALSRAGLAALFAVGLASTPVLACAAVGIPIVYGRKLAVGDYAEVGRRLGRVRLLTLLDVQLVDEDGCEIHVPHLASLLSPTRVFGRTPRATLEVAVDPQRSQAKVRAALLEAAEKAGTHAKVELVRLDADGAHYRVSANVGTGASPHRSGALPKDADLASIVADALVSADIGLGRGSSAATNPNAGSRSSGGGAAA